MKKTIIFLCFLLLGYLCLINLAVIPYFPGQYVYIIKPLCWIFLAFITYIITKDKYIKINKKDRILQACIIIVLIYLLLYYLSGLYLGFTESAYNHSFIDILKNLYAIVMVVILEEYVRYRILTYDKKNIFLLIFVTLSFVLVELNYLPIFTKLINNAEIFKFIFSELIPLICLNFLYSYLVIVNNYKASIIFRVPSLLLIIILGIYPTWNWYIFGCIQVIYAGVSYMIIKNYIRALDKTAAKLKAKKYTWVMWIVFIITLICLTLFVSGKFKNVPIAIMSNSMIPTFERGDLLIYEKITDEKELKVGKIMVFWYDDKIICHRIKKV
ncbi:MAG: S26 family signal peptidase, partial [Bacilli bacterium]